MNKLNKRVNKMVRELSETLRKVDRLVFPNQLIPIKILNPDHPAITRMQKKQLEMIGEVNFPSMGYLPKGDEYQLEGFKEFRGELYLIYWEGCKQALLSFMNSPQWKSGVPKREEWIKVDLVVALVLHEVRHRVQWCLETELYSLDKILIDSNIPPFFKQAAQIMDDFLVRDGIRIPLQVFMKQTLREEMVKREIDAYIIQSWATAAWRMGIRDFSTLARMVRLGSKFFHNSST